jgi:STE24 endopeptidase
MAMNSDEEYERGTIVNVENPTAPPASDMAPGGVSLLSPAQLAEAKQYGRISLACDLLDRFIDLVFLGAIAFLWARPLDAALAALTGLTGAASTPRLALLFLSIYAMHLAISFPLSFYSGHVVERRFGLSQQSVGRWLSRYLLRHALGVAFGLVMFVGLYWIIWTIGSWWWLIAAIAFVLVSIVLGQLAPVLIVPLFYKITPLDNEDLRQRMHALSRGTSLSIEGVYRMGMSAETTKANAMLAGLGRTRRVLMGDTLLDNFSHDEIEVIFAHEIGHHVHRHIPKILLAGAAYGLVGLWLCDRLLVAYVGGAGASFAYSRTPTWTLPLLMFALTVFGMLLEPLQNSISRHFERQCDRYALLRTDKPAAYRTAFTKLARQNKADPEPHPLEVFLFHSHPPIRERLELAEAGST